MTPIITETAPLSEVSQALGLTEGRLKRGWRALHERNGFPPPLPGGGWVWSRSAVLRWIGSAHAPAAQALPSANDNPMRQASNGLDGTIAAQADHLRQKYGPRS